MIVITRAWCNGSQCLVADAFTVKIKGLEKDTTVSEMWSMLSLSQTIAGFYVSAV